MAEHLRPADDYRRPLVAVWTLTSRRVVAILPALGDSFPIVVVPLC